MTAFVAEAKRLGIHVPSGQVTHPLNRTMPDGSYDNEGLHVSCNSCRDFRNEVRAAQEAERQENLQFVTSDGWPRRFTKEDIDRIYDAGYNAAIYDAREVVDLYTSIKLDEALRSLKPRA